ncbi:MAG: lamin tail domain-containing protein [Deltaproteobacteria bacterium]|nr:lamin tail domain-containing protein [Deltaproteobacteria bacterium]
MRSSWNRAGVVAVVAAALLSLTAAGCGDEVVYDTLYLAVSSDAPADGSTLDAIRFLAVASDGQGGTVSWPASPNDPEYVLPLSASADPTVAPVIVKVQYRASTFAASSGVVTLQIAGRAGARTVTSWEGEVDLAKKGQVVARLLATPAGVDCDADADGFLDCSLAGCCASTTSVFSDCEPGDASANPWGTEDACEPCSDTLDNDCSGGDVACVDADSDGVADCAEAAAGCGVGDPNVAPGLAERCDDVDNDCDDQTDEGFVLSYGGQTLTKGASCGTGACEGGTVVCGSATALACSTDGNKSDETCGNAVDDDCDGDTDEGCEAADIDGDGQSAPRDCNDFDSGIYDGAPEPCCPLANQGDAAATAACDKNCDGEPTWCAAGDQDGDGYTAAQGDCDDTDPLSHPNADERCGDGIDQNCIAGDLPCDGVTDGDGDGWPAGVDCNDGDDSVHPGADDVCNGVDDDCDGAIDDGNPGGGAVCGSDVGECSTGVEVCNNTATDKGVVLCVGDVRPVDDVCDGLDNDCNDVTDGPYLAGGTVKFDGGPFTADADKVKGDACGTGACSGGTVVCGEDTLSLTCSTLGSVAGETCDGVDNDCNGVTDDDFPNYDGDALADCVDDDDDDDGVADVSDACPQGDKGWTSSEATDRDYDGCQDAVEDLDDDNDGISDVADSCKDGDLGWTSSAATDHDTDGCQDSAEDQDDDNDGKSDDGDLCARGELGWTSGSGTDHDDDGCQDASEDQDDDNDGKLDAADACARGDLGWTANAATDYDGDGCRDAGEDQDDDNDGVSDDVDRCDPDASGPAEDTGTASSEKGWTSTVGTGGVPGTDYDGDGCRDASAEDQDDDNDGVSDAVDRCDPDAGAAPDTGAVMSEKGWTSGVGTAGAPGTDYDADGCRDAAAEDTDDDNDGVADGVDACDPDASGPSGDSGVVSSEKGWTSSKGTAGAPGSDWDEDGCRDAAAEDDDDDNDGKADASDLCDPDAGGAGDVGVMGSVVGWTRTVGTAGAPGSDWDDDGCRDSDEDGDDDNDGKLDAADLCDPDASGAGDLGAQGSQKGWTRTVGTTAAPGNDWDDDGCQDANEDPDDDNDGVGDAADRCDPDASGPSGDSGAVGSEKGWTSTVGSGGTPGTDYDQDGCRDAAAEDDDDDDDGIADAVDRCDPDAGAAPDTGAVMSEKGWTSTVGTAGAPGSDWDADGCRDAAAEDGDDDNDGVLDAADACDPDAGTAPDTGAVGSEKGWTSTVGTAGAPGSDWDGDGCRDAASEDDDDDNDGKADASDLCDPDATGAGDTGAVGSAKGWTRTVGTAGAPGSDWDDDGCQDSGEDTDDDNDGALDAVDRCDPDASGPAGDTGAVGSTKGWTRTVGTAGAPGSDWDDDGCQDVGEDTDDDNDGVGDAVDRCDPDASGPTGDTGAVGSEKGWTSTAGTAGAPGSDWDADGCRDATTEDDDDDNDGKADSSDLCDPDDTGGNDLGAMGSAIGWTRTVGTAGAPGSDWDDDGCQDSGEDTDDDNDGVADAADWCDPDAGAAPDTGAVGSEKNWVAATGSGSTPGTDYDGDGCRDASAEDDDDDNDGIADGADRCDPDAGAAPDTGAVASQKGWTSTVTTGSAPGTDYDADGCRDSTSEDTDDDNDGVLDTNDQCDPDASGPTGDLGATLSDKGWTATTGTAGAPGTDWDGDGCRDAGEDTDDDNDGALDAVDRCDPDATGPTGDTGAVGSTKGWTRTVGTAGAPGSDWDDDGCQDSGEDTDDDNDGALDAVDLCDPDAGTPTGDTGAVGSAKDWTRSIGTAASPGTDWDDDGCQDSGEDTDDDNDGALDAADWCDPDASGPTGDTGAVGSAKGWTRSIGTQAAPGTDWDDDGCQDSGEDLDDDNDGASDSVDRCDPDASGPSGDTGAVGSTKAWTRTVGTSGAPGSDWDDDGCQDAGEDLDDDNDGASDSADRCDPDASGPAGDTGAVGSTKGWSRTIGTTGAPGSDWDDDGCQDAGEDPDDDNDGVTDGADLCDPDASGPSGDTGAVGSEKTWTATVLNGAAPGTDYDGDGCRDDATEDNDDDNDGKIDSADRCDPDASGPTGDTGAVTSVKGWAREPGVHGTTNSDNDDDGCRDSDEDLDDDNDAILDDGGASTCANGVTASCDDNCPYTQNADQADPDGDAVGTVCDNCPIDPNPDQTDLDGDGLGLVCDDSEDSPGNTCPAATVLALDTSTPGDTTGTLLSDALTPDGCPAQGTATPNDGLGTDQVFVFTAPSDGVYEVTLTPTTADLIVYAFSDLGNPLCESTECYGWANGAGAAGVEKLELGMLQDQMFFIVVDAANGVEGAFSISVTATPCPAPDLFISKYLDGTQSGEKAIEIFNGTDHAVDLAAGGYELWKIDYGSGNKSWSSNRAEHALTGTIQPGDVFVVCVNSPSSSISTQCDDSTSFLGLERQRSVALVKGGEIGSTRSARTGRRCRARAGRSRGSAGRRWTTS